MLDIPIIFGLGLTAAAAIYVVAFLGVVQENHRAGILIRNYGWRYWVAEVGTFIGLSIACIFVVCMLSWIVSLLA